MFTDFYREQRFWISLSAALLTVLGATSGGHAEISMERYQGAAAENSCKCHQNSINFPRLDLRKDKEAIAYSCVSEGVCGTEMTELRDEVEKVIGKFRALISGMLFLDLETGNYLDINGDRVFPAASTIKLPILIAFFQDVDAGKVSLDETWVMRRDLITNGSGTMQYRRAGTKFTARETVTKMVTISDNTATNMVIDRLGGIAKLNQRFRSWGLKHTVMHHLLADLRGTNKTSSQDMVRLMALLVNNKLVSESSREQILDLLRHTVTKSLLPAGLGEGAAIANKTGHLGVLVGDTGIIDMPNGKRYLAAIFVRRPHRDPRARNLISQISRLVYNYLDRQAAIAKPPLPDRVPETDL